jgi:hypothetical protein
VAGKSEGVIKLLKTLLAAKSLRMWITDYYPQQSSIDTVVVMKVMNILTFRNVYYYSFSAFSAYIIGSLPSMPLIWNLPGAISTVLAKQL